MSIERASMIMAKRYGERGSPWLSPLVPPKNLASSPFMFKENFGVVMHSQIQLTKRGGKPNLERSSRRKDHFTVSKALEDVHFNSTPRFGV